MTDKLFLVHRSSFRVHRFPFSLWGFQAAGTMLFTETELLFRSPQLMEAS